MVRFALLRHEVPDDPGRQSHWDLLLEREDACWTWSLEKLPGPFAKQDEPSTVEAHRMPDHRKHYLEYEGPVSGGRGTVANVLYGTCEIEEQHAGHIVVGLEFGSNAIVIQLRHVADDVWQLSCMP